MLDSADLAPVADIPPAVLFDQALARQAQGQYLVAEQGYRMILARERRYPAVFFNLGALLAARGAYDEAIDLYRQALALAPDDPDIHANLANALAFQGRHEEAVAAYRQALALAPQEGRIRCNLARVLMQHGDAEGAKRELFAALADAPGLEEAQQLLARLERPAGDRAADIQGLLAEAKRQEESGVHDEAERLLRSAVLAAPESLQGHAALAEYLVRRQRWDEAIMAWRQAIRLDPGFANLYSHLASCLAEAGFPDEASLAYQQALELDPSDAAVHNNLAVLLADRGFAEEARKHLETALELDPLSGDAHFNLAVYLMKVKDITQAERHLEEAILLEPERATFHAQLAGLLAASGRVEAAVETISRAIEIEPANPAYYNDLGIFLDRLGRAEESYVTYLRAIQLNPDAASPFTNLGKSVHDLGRASEAMTFYLEAIRRKPDNAVALSNLGGLMIESWQFDDALSLLLRAIEIAPDLAGAYSNIGNALREMGRCREAVPFYREAIARQPDYTALNSNLLLAMHYLPEVTPAEHRREAEAWYERHGRPLLPATPVAPSDPNPDRRLRVGFLSGDLRRHPVAYFLAPYLEHHDPEQVFIACYSTRDRNDALTEQLKAHADLWRAVAYRTDAEIAAQIRDDQIDILIELAGHTAHNALRVMAAKPAPVQVSWLGYPDTTGVATIDWRFSDPIADPPGVSDAASVERLYRLPHGFHCYAPPEEMVEVKPLPALSSPRITFGCFNTLAKLTPEVIDFWARLMGEIPNSQLRLKAAGLHEPSVRRRVLEAFAKAGVEAERIDLVGRLPSQADHFELYNTIDVALDPFPYNGTTTICEAAWMGVPTLTLVGTGQHARMGISLNTRLGLTDFVATTPEGYIAIAQRLEADRDGLARVRQGLRSRMAASPICDGPAFARTFEAALRDMWRQRLGAGA